MSVHKFNESFHKFRSSLQHLLNPLTHNYHTSKILYALPAKARPKIILMELTDMVQDLDVELRLPFEMHYIGHPFQEIADILKLPLHEVKSNIQIARMELKATIETRYGHNRA